MSEVIYTSVFASGILETPVSMNVSLIGSIKLNCTAVADFIEWYVNNEWARQQAVKDKMDLEFSTTTIDATKNIHKATLLARNSTLVNNSEIYCRASIKHMENISETIVIRVQGM